MRKTFKLGVLLAAGLVLVSSASFAGNEDRVGQAGAQQLLINPWARSSGFGGANSASVTGLEAMYWNVAGMSFTRKTEVMFSHTRWLVGSDINLNTFGFSQKMGEASVLGLGIMTMDFGDIPITTVDLPEGDNGTFSPQFMNFGLSYAKIFSNRIYGGITVRVVSESISNLNSMGFCFDAGIQYVTSVGDRSKERNKDNLHFGIALKNVGPPMQYSGDGMSIRAVLNSGSNITLEQRSAQFELPSLLNIGLTYHYRMAEDHRLSFSGTFTSNSFSKDQYRAGLEYAFKNYVMLRGGYVYEADVNDQDMTTTDLAGPAAGLTLRLPVGKEKVSSIDLDYAYQVTTRFAGIHSIGVRIAL